MKTPKIQFWWVLLLVPLAGCAAPTKNGFDLQGALVPPEEIFSGGPPRDGIPAIDHPRFVRAADADFLKPDGRVLGVVRNGSARAYPIAILNWHEIVNDEFAGEPVAVTYCPLTGSGIAYASRLGKRTLSLGVSGLLYSGNLVMYDRESESLWSQLMERAISGPLKGQRLKPLPLVATTWADWRAHHPDTWVLATRTGHRRNYNLNPYGGYELSPRVPHPLAHYDRRYPPKEKVVGVELNGHVMAWPFAELARTSGEARGAVGGVAVTVRFDPSHQTAVVYGTDGKVIPSVTAYWFAWAAFHPDTGIFRAGKASQ